MFDKLKFSQIIKNISDTYESQRDFSKKSGINRTYLSQYMNMKLDEPPKPNILKKLANSSHSIISYEELMLICGYLTIDNLNNENLLNDYEKLNILEDNYKKDRFKQSFVEMFTLGSEEFKVYLSTRFKIIDCVCNDIPLNKEQDFYDLIGIYDFLSEASKKKIVKLLMKFYSYYHEKHILEKDIKKEVSNPSNDNDNIGHVSKQDFYMCPVYGQISAGIPNWAEECIEGRLPIDPSLMDIVNPEECFFLRVNGESMNKVISNGAYALIRKTDWVENGEIAVVLVNGYDATLKKFTKQNDVIVLEPMSNDSTFQVQIYDKSTPIKVIGKYIGKFEMK